MHIDDLIEEQLTYVSWARTYCLQKASPMPYQEGLYENSTFSIDKIHELGIEIKIHHKEMQFYP